MKTPTQEKLEAQRNKDISELVPEALAKFRGQKNFVLLAAIDLEVSAGTLNRWCEEMGINPDEYRRELPVGQA